MDPFFVTAIVFAVVFAIALVVRHFVPKTYIEVGRYGRDDVEIDNSSWRRLANVVVSAIGVLVVVFFLCSTFVVIQTRHVGETVTFGKPGVTLENGFHPKNPVSKVRKYDGTLQTLQYENGKNDDGNAFTVQLGSGGYATIEVTYQFKLSKSIDQIYKDYPTADTADLNSKVVLSEVQQQLNIVYANFDPTIGLQAQSAALTAQLNGTSVGTGTQTYNAAGTYLDYGTKALTAIQAALAPQDIDFTKLTIRSFHPDATTQARINKYQAAITDTQLAIQAKATAIAIAAANKSISANPPSLQQNIQTCLSDVAKNPAAYKGVFLNGCNLGGSASTPLLTLPAP